MRFFYSFGVGLLGASLLLPSLSTAQSVPCPPAGIRTDPPVATNPGGAVNTFNWYYGSYQPATYSGSRYALYSPYPGVGQDYIELPWRQPSNTNMDRFQGKLDLPQDGWELIRRDLGYDDASNPAKTTNPTLILYNKRTGMLRVFVAVGDLLAGYQFAEIKLKFGTSATYKAGTLNRQTALGVALEDTESGTNPEFVAVARYLNGRSKWFVADFPMEYDPCVCQFDSRLQVEVNLISQANIQQTGKTKGTLVTTANGSSSTGSDMDKGIPFIRKVNGVLEAGGKSYDNIDKFTSKMAGQNPDKANALSALNTASKSSSFLKAGLSALPYVGAALSMLDYFMGGGKDEGPQQVSVQPMTIEMSTTTTGTMTATSLYATVPFHNPGNRLTTTIPENVPYYNEAMGVISLLKRPILEVKRTTTIQPNRDREIYTDIRLSADLSYVINPASGLEVQDFQAAIVATGPDVADQSGSGDFYNFEGKVARTDGTFSNAYRTDYVDAACLTSNTYSWQQFISSGGNSPAGSLLGLTLKIMVNLRPINASSTTQNVLFVARYPVTQQTVTSFSIRSPQVSCGVLAQATPATVAALCSSNKYQQAITLLRTTSSSTNAASTVGGPALPLIAQLRAIPNPATGLVRLSYQVPQPGRVRIALHDNMGRELRTILDQKQEAGTFEIPVSLAGLSAGIYYTTLQTTDQRVTERLAVIN